MVAPTPSLLTVPSRRLRGLARVIRLGLWLVVSTWVLFALAWVVLHGWIVPRINDYRPWLEREASQSLGVAVRIEKLTAQSDGLVPTFELHGVTLLDAHGNTAVRLPRVQGVITARSLLGLDFQQLYIERPELDIYRSTTGRIYVGGLDVSPDVNTDSSAAANWFFSQAEFIVRNGTMRWRDDLRQAPLLALTQVDVVVRNTGQRHQMRVDATPPPEWGERFTLRGLFRQPLLSRQPGDVRSWTGQLYADFSRLDVAQARRYVSLQSLGVVLNSGYGALRGWVDVRDGQPIGALADVALRQVNVQLGDKLKPLAFENMAGRVGGSYHAQGFDFSTQNLRFRTLDGLQWPGGNVALTHTRSAQGVPLATTLQADQLDLTTLAQIAGRLPLEPSVRALVASFAPRGLVHALDARWQGAVDAPTNLLAKGRVTGLQLAAQANAANAPAHEPGRPGISGADVDFELTDDGGQARVQLAKGALDLPGVFEDPRVLLDRLSVDAKWRHNAQRTHVELRNLQFANADAQGQAQLTWDHDASRTPTGVLAANHVPGVIKLQGSISRGVGTRVHRYLPLVLPSQVRYYVRDAVLAGQISDVKFNVNGPVNDVPFNRPTDVGDFKVALKVRQGKLAYVPPGLQPKGSASWPALTDLQGELVFERASLDLLQVQASLDGMPLITLRNGQARIPDLMHQATVEVSADLKGPLNDALRFVNTSPISAMTGDALVNASAQGVADYQIKLRLPINAIDQSTVQARIQLPGNELQIRPDIPRLRQLKGVLDITEKSLALTGVQAQLLGGEVRLEGGLSGKSAATLQASVKAQGTVTAEGLRQARELGLLPALAKNASGSTAYTAALGVRQGVPELTFSSSLQGLSLGLPAPLNKAADVALPLRLNASLLRDPVSGQLQDRLTVSLDQLASVHYQRDLSGPEPRVIRGTLAVGLPAGDTVPVPESGVAANIQLARVDLDAWERVFARAPASPTPGTVANATRWQRPDVGAQAYLPTSMSIRAQELVLQGRELHRVVVGGSRQGLTWRVNIYADELNGYVEARQPSPQEAGRVYARLARLSLAANNATDVESFLNEQPASIPALDIVVDDFELRGKRLGRLEIDAVNRAVSVAARDSVREWRLNKLNLTMPEATLSATGNWVSINALTAGKTQLGRRRTVLNFKLDLGDSGELLTRFGMPGVIRRGKGKLEGQVAWIGSPLSLDYPSMNGQFNVAVESGQFMKADPGLAKLLGVLSLQSLPRRLTLDFRDVFSQGFAFDFVRGDVTIQQGVASTNNLQMRGVNAAVLMQGTADIAQETQNLRVVVVPEINAGTASLIATVINPAVGLGTFLAQMFLRKPLMEAATQEFHVEGTWADPKIVKQARRTRSETLAPVSPTAPASAPAAE